MVTGEVYRVNVFRGRVLDVVRREMAFVVGDGTATLGELVKARNRVQRNTRGLYARRKQKFRGNTFYLHTDNLLNNCSRLGERCPANDARNDGAQRRRPASATVPPIRLCPRYAGLPRGAEEKGGETWRRWPGIPCDCRGGLPR